MKYCQNCGKQIHEAAKFCECCGYEQKPLYPKVEADTQPQVNHVPSIPDLVNQQSSHTIHCPVCKSNNLQAVMDTHTTAGDGIAIPIGRFFALGASNSKTQYHYEWLCQDCGHRFPQIPELKKALASRQAEQNIALVFFLISIAVTVYVFFYHEVKSLLYVSIPCILIFFLIFAYAETKKRVLNEEIYFYEIHCYNRRK